jgi:hypothetical protein
MSPHHFPKNTVEASVWCNTCNKMTPWRILNGRRGFCIPCYGKQPAASKPVAKPEAEQQLEMFKGGK